MLTNKAIERFEAAVRAHVFKGASRPEELDDIDQEYEAAKVALKAAIDKVRRPAWLAKSSKGGGK